MNDPKYQLEYELYAAEQAHEEMAHQRDDWRKIAEDLLVRNTKLQRELNDWKEQCDKLEAELVKVNNTYADTYARANNYRLTGERNFEVAERLAKELDKSQADRERLHMFGEKVNNIRNSIIGTQQLNWSEHVYPLVAALDEAGFAGLSFPEARAKMSTLIEQAASSKAEVERLHNVQHDVRILVSELSEAIEQSRVEHGNELVALRERCAVAAESATLDELRPAPDYGEVVRAVPLEVES